MRRRFALLGDLDGHERFKLADSNDCDADCVRLRSRLLFWQMLPTLKLDIVLLCLRLYHHLMLIG